MKATENLIETRLIINGEWIRAKAGETYPRYNPANPDELVGHAATGTADDVDLACKAAHAAFPAWSGLSYQERGEYLKKLADHLTDDEEELKSRIHLFTREHGKILKESGVEMMRLGDRFRLCAAYAPRLAVDEELRGPPFDTIITRQPRGVAALVVPWNWPLSILGAKLPQALISGNTVVIKLSAEATMAPALTIRKMADALPPGVINLITGPSSRNGDALLTHPLVRKINFTGGTETGRHVMKMAADRLTPVTLELGGNDACIVLEDANLDDGAFMRMYMGAFMSTGQICMALKRLYVHVSRYDDVVSGMKAIASRAVVGDGTHPDVTMGPVNNKAQLEVVQGMLDEARSKNADVQEMGTVLDEEMYKKGYFQKPTLVLDPDPSLLIVREEQFGPAVPILPFQDEAEAVRLANDSEYGLCSSVWTGDKDRALDVARQLEAGYTYINGHGPMAQDNRGPFGGFKSSGIGRNLGYEGVLEFQEYHSISSPPGWLFSDL